MTLLYVTLCLIGVMFVSLLAFALVTVGAQGDDADGR